MKISKELRVALLAIIAITILILGYNWLNGNNVFSKGEDYHVFYQNANGLQVGDAVLINGLKVGKVKDIILLEKNAGVEAIINLTTVVSIPTDSKAMIGGDLLGEKYIQLILGSSDIIVTENEFIDGEVEIDVMNEIKRLSSKINLMISSIDTTIIVLGSIFTENLKDDFAKSIIGIKQTLDSFNKSAARFNEILVREEPKIEDIISNVSEVTDYVKKSESEVKAILSNLHTLTDTLNQIEWNELAIELNAAAANINLLTEKINSGEGTLGLLLNDKDLYLKLNETLGVLDTTLTKFIEDPTIKLKLFGK